MSKIDYKKSLKHLYAPSASEIQFVDVPTLNYLSISGKGRPEGEDYQNALHALYPVAYKIKFWMKENMNFDYVVDTEKVSATSAAFMVFYQYQIKN